MRHRAITAAAIAGCALALGSGCKPRPHEPGPALQILGEASAIRSDETVPATSPWFDGKLVHLVAARGETLGIEVLHRGGGAVTLALASSGVAIRSFEVRRVHVEQPSTDLYGGSRGRGDYPDTLVETATPRSDPAYFEIAVAAGMAAGTYHGELAVADQRIAVVLDVSTAIMPALPAESVWAYEDPRELGWTGLPGSSLAAPSDGERGCIAMFRSYGVLLSPDLPIEAWPARRELLAGVPDVPVTIPEDPAHARDAVRAWIAATAGTHQVPFAIPIDEPRDEVTRARVTELATAVREAGGGSATFRYAVTAAPSPKLVGPIDLYLAGGAAHLAGDAYARWTYNGRPPEAGAMVVDAAEPGLRTWGWIAWRYHIPTWYVWDALYWHDRHNRPPRSPLPGDRHDPARDAITFDDHTDHGNLDGVLAEPGDAQHACLPTLRLAALRRGLEDRALLDAAFACDPAATTALAARMIPRALGDAGGGAAAWPGSDADFERARIDVIALAAACTNRLPR